MINILSPENLSKNVEIDRDIIFTADNISYIDLYINNIKIIESGLSLFNDVTIINNGNLFVVKHNKFSLNKINILTIIDRKLDISKTSVFKTQSTLKNIVNFIKDDNNIRINIKSILNKINENSFIIILNNNKIYDNSIINNDYMIDIIKYNDYTFDIIIKEKYKNFQDTNIINLFITDEFGNVTNYTGTINFDKKDKIIKQIYQNVKANDEYNDILQFVYEKNFLVKKDDIRIKYKHNGEYKYIYYDNNLLDQNFGVNIFIDNFITIELDTSNVFLNKLELTIEITDFFVYNYTFYKKMVSRVDFLYNDFLDYNDDIKIDIIQIGNTKLLSNTLNLNDGIENLVLNGEPIKNYVKLTIFDRYIKITINKNIYVESKTFYITISDVFGNIYNKKIDIYIKKDEPITLDIFPKSGKYYDALSINIFSNLDGVVYYTLDGTIPNENNYTTLYKYTENKKVNIPIIGSGKWILKARLKTKDNTYSKIYTEIYDINTSKPEIFFDNIKDGDIVDSNNLILQYRIVNNYGIITKIILQINDNYYNIINNNEGFIPISLINNINTIKMIAYNDYGNYGEKQIRIFKNQGYLESIKITYADIYNIRFPSKMIKNVDNTQELFSVDNICIIGYGKRKEILYNGYNGSISNVNYNKNNKIDKRHFEINERYLPILDNSFDLYLIHNNNTIKLKRRYLNNTFTKEYNEYGYLLDEKNGYVVLDYPIVDGDVLYCEYIPANNINNMYTFYNINDCIEYYGDIKDGNTISISADILFKSGVGKISAIQLNPFFDDRYLIALKNLEKYESIYVVLPAILKTDDYNQITYEILKHCEKMSYIGNRRERITLSAYSVNDNNQDYDNTYRMFKYVFNYKNRDIYYFNGVEKINLDVSYALFPLISNYINNIGKLYINNSIIKNYIVNKENIIKLSKGDIIDYDNNNINIVIDKDNIIQVNSNNSSVKYMDISVVIVMDYIQKNIRRVLQDSFIGNIIDDNLLIKIKKSINDYLIYCKNSKIIKNYKLKDVVIDDIDKRQINVFLTINPYYYLKDINLTVDITI